nr:MGMT family protein [Intestinimonas butyriciproducens]
MHGPKVWYTEEKTRGRGPVSYYDRVYEIARRIPRGRAATYGQIALMTGSPRAARAVGYAMAACTDPAVPCHRILARDGAIREHAFGPGVQRALLEAEGVPFTPDGRVDLSRCRWDGR